MPELPDVEVFRQYIEATSLHHRIEDVDLRTRQVLEDTSVEELESELEGLSFESTSRHGKHLFVELSDGNWLRLHFGMTGNLQYFKDMEKEPEYDRLLISFSNGYHLAYQSQRKLGEIELVEDVEDFVERRELGPDVLDPGFDLETFKEALAGRRGMAKSTLMNQCIMAGIGNVYSDEILFQAQVHPRAKVDQPDNEILAEVFHQMKDVLQTAIECQAEPEQFPDSYIIPHRHEEGKCPMCGGELERVKVSGRTAYYCPNRQEDF